MAIISDGSSVDGRSFSHGFALRNCAQWHYSISIDLRASRESGSSTQRRSAIWFRGDGSASEETEVLPALSVVGTPG